MNINQFFKERARFFVSQDVVEPLSLVIEDCRIEVVGVGDRAQEKPLLSFESCDKLLPLSRLNSQTLTELFGTDDTVAWRGRAIVLYCDRAGSFRGSAGSIRVRAPAESDGATTQDSAAPF